MGTFGIAFLNMAILAVMFGGVVLLTFACLYLASTVDVRLSDSAGWGMLLSLLWGLPALIVYWMVTTAAIVKGMVRTADFLVFAVIPVLGLVVMVGWTVGNPVVFAVGLMLSALFVVLHASIVRKILEDYLSLAIRTPQRPQNQAELGE